MDWEFFLPWIVTSISVLAGVLAWIAKLRWSKEYIAAKEEIIKAKDAVIELKDSEVERLKNQIEDIKVIYDPSTIKTHFELRDIRHARALEDMKYSITQSALAKAKEMIEESVLQGESKVDFKDFWELLSYVIKDIIKISPEFRSEYIQNCFPVNNGRVLFILEELKKNGDFGDIFDPDSEDGPWQRYLEIWTGGTRIAMDQGDKWEAFIRHYYPLTGEFLMEEFRRVLSERKN